MADVMVIPAFGDNLIYLHPCGDGGTLAVDPGDASAVLHALRRRRLSLTAILATHHHGDHVGGVPQLKSQTQCQVVGPDERRIPSVDRSVADGETLTFGPTTVRVLATPGHTTTSVCYLVTGPSSEDPEIVYTGDTLFVGGCGRLLECDARTMWRSLRRLASLPERTGVYCGHNYTLENYEFALTIEPDNDVVRRRLQELRADAARGRVPGPSTIGQEKATNVFLRAGDATLQASLGRPDAEPFEIFADLRRRKDSF